MSESAPDATLDDFSAPPEEGGPAQDNPTVDVGSAGTGTKMVEVSRFNGLMSKHQAALADLEVERTRRTALEARLQEKDTVAEDNSVLSEVQLLREELKQEKLAAYRRELLERYPSAQPFADLFVGANKEDLEGVISQVASRVDAMNASQSTPTPTPTPTADGTPAATPETPAAPVAPVVAGGSAPPRSDPSQSPEKLQEALDKGDWNAYWAAKTPNPANLG